ncbi:phosphoribosylformylglycinamidine synthase subunit PurQ [Hwanghaeella grinnelliae]|uniref:Phosphoribosylformylglycinamidine synthase subunit PurQ n=1 Tax=Hwanghaeella grinnelliae TaxID=2500179 RepID=A0A437QK61_9PROT|nr:phosphoribosylformylglycinamidine synthase subunit PurQ [Hwanghaeella grinnelliae]RVU34907.1 phosphoribosylformylglycinamidine synthase subunit PurQ [Hwanghaeella grinnelliae]
MRAAVIVFPGTNREKDIAEALERASGKKAQFVWHGDSDLPDVDLIVVPGGFSYGDYLRCGAMAGNSPVMRAVKQKADAGVRVLGVCNGFQILTETGLLPGVLMRNAQLKFICKKATLTVQNSDSDFSSAYSEGQRVVFPVAHNEGNYFADDATLDRLEGEDRVVFRYADADGTVNKAGNINGSQRNIAGILNEKRNVLGMMPHPENATDPAQGGTDGLGLFKSLAEVLQ